mmetsp:Transcript_19676/g.38306  ORF Transcript_19676/g.38306 Transcript_19676/m.38306 type:complete len:381 (-) Transcript_19676:499-1641(-)
MRSEDGATRPVGRVAELALEEARELLRVVEAEARALHRRLGRARRAERLEQLGHKVCGHAAARVAHLQTEACFVIYECAEREGALGRVLDRVARQIDQHHEKPVPIAAHHRRHLRRHAHLHLDTCGLAHISRDGGHLLEQLRWAEVSQRWLEVGAGLELGVGERLLPDHLEQLEGGRGAAHQVEQLRVVVARAHAHGRWLLRSNGESFLLIALDAHAQQPEEHLQHRDWRAKVVRHGTDVPVAHLQTLLVSDALGVHRALLALGRAPRRRHLLLASDLLLLHQRVQRARLLVLQIRQAQSRDRDQHVKDGQVHLTRRYRQRAEQLQRFVPAAGCKQRVEECNGPHRRRHTGQKDHQQERTCGAKHLLADHYLQRVWACSF